jgi:NitT/TauT family transport system substrate-binding protein
MTDDQIAYSTAAMKRCGLVDSGDARTLGIGAMTDTRWAAFAASMKRSASIRWISTSGRRTGSGS